MLPATTHKTAPIRPQQKNSSDKTAYPYLPEEQLMGREKIKQGCIPAGTPLLSPMLAVQSVSRTADNWDLNPDYFNPMPCGTSRRARI